MKNKHVLALVVAGVALAALAWVSSREKTPGTEKQIGTNLLPGLDINAVDEIIITAGTETSRVVRAESGWQVPDRYYYPANFDGIRRLMLKLEQLKIGQTIKANEQQRAKMQLSAAEATVLCLKADGRQVAEIKLGSNRQSQNADAGPYGFGSMPDGRFVSINEDTAVYLISDILYEVTAQQKQWLETALLDVPSGDITAMTIGNPGVRAFTLCKKDDGKWDFDPSDESAPLDESKIFALTSALSKLTMQDVADPILADEDLGFKSTKHLFQATTKDGTIYDMNISEPIPESGDRYIRISVRYGGQVGGAQAVTEGTDGIDKAAGFIMAAEEAKNKASALNTKFDKWTFRIASYKADVFVTTRDSLIKKPEPLAEQDAKEASDTENEGTPHE